MKRFVSAICWLSIIGSLALGVQKAGNWIKYSSLDGHYSVMLPSQPTLGTQESNTAEGVKFTQYKAIVEDGDTVYLVGYFDQAPGTDFSFERARAGMLEAMNGTVLSESKLTLAANPGLELKIAIKDEQGNEYLVQARFYNVDKRVYMLQFLYPKTKDAAAMNAAGAKYFDSFQLLPN